MADWSDFIQTGSYKGIAFDFVSTQDELGRVVDRQQIPGRDGVQLVDRAREGRVFDVVAIFVEDDYPDLMNKLLDAIDAGGIGEFVHPIFGSFQAMVTHAAVSHSADDSIDSATVQLRIDEHTPAQVGPTATKTSTAAKSSWTRSKAIDVLNAVTFFAGAADAIPGITATAAAAVAKLGSDATAAANLASSAADSLEQDGDTMSAIEVQATTNSTLSAIDAVVQSISSCVTVSTPIPEQYDLMQALIVMATSLEDLATVVAAGKPALTQYQVDADIPLLSWVHAKYGDSSRADEVLALNQWITDPLLIPAGSLVTAYAG